RRQAPPRKIEKLPAAGSSQSFITNSHPHPSRSTFRWQEYSVSFRLDDQPTVKDRDESDNRVILEV
ncbi:MAG: hypothetical protein ABLT11_03715, partial [Candidatus Acidiferrum sp.]